MNDFEAGLKKAKTSQEAYIYIFRYFDTAIEDNMLDPINLLLDNIDVLKYKDDTLSMHSNGFISI